MQPASITVPASCLLVFVDETGEESLRDPRFPVFGLAGCAMRADTYFGTVAVAWRAIKTEYFGGPNVPLHASEFDPSNRAAVQALGQFFRSHHFSRFGVTVTHLTTLRDISVYQATALALLQRLRDVARWWSFDQLRFICEQSARGDALARQHLATWNYRREVDGKQVAIPVDRHFMPKSANTPGMEIADFLAHTLGATARAKLEGRTDLRADFTAMFKDVDGKLVSEVNLTEAELNVSETRHDASGS